MKIQPGNPLNLGTTGDGASLTLSPDDRSRHLYVAGATRSGKSKFLEHCMRQDIKRWRKSKCPVVFFDPHGSSYDALVAWLAWNQPFLKDLPVILIDPRQDWIVGYNVLRRRESDTAVVIDNFVAAMAHAFGETSATPTPLFAQIAQDIFWVLYELKLTLAETVYLTDFEGERLRKAMVSGVGSPEIRRDWRNLNNLPAVAFDERVGSTVRRLRAFVGHERMKWMFGQQEESLDWREVLDKGAIVLCNLSLEKGRLSAERAAVLGSTMLHDLWLSAVDRGKKKGVPPCYVYIDEFQTFVSPTLAKSLAQASGFGLHLTMSHQFPTQLVNEGPHGKAVYDEVMGNAQNKVVFHTEHPADLRTLAEMLFLGIFDPNKIQLELRSRKILDYREEIRMSEQESETEGESEGMHEAEVSGAGSATATRLDEDGNPVLTELESEHGGEISGKSGGSSRSRTRGVSRIPVQIPVFGEEVSSVQFESRDWQLHRAMVALRDQAQRWFVAKIHNWRVPVTVQTPSVKDTPADTKRIRRYVEDMRKPWRFMLPEAEAQKRIEVRQEGLEERFLAAPSQEPETARRRVPRKPPGQ